MSQENEQHRNIRRFGRKDQKAEIEPVSKLFPDEPAHLGDLPGLDELPDHDAAALEALSQVGDAVRPLTITAPEERYPPTDPDAVSSPQAAPPVVLPPKKGTLKYNITTLFIVLATLFLCGIFAIIWQDPQSPLNPLPPPTEFIVVTATPQGIITDNASASPTALIPTDTPQQTDSIAPPFQLANSGILYIQNENGRGCDWTSVAGSVTGLANEPLNGMAIRVIGDNLDEKVFSGTAQTFGAGGYELPLGGVPQEAEYSVQLLTAAGAPLSDPFTVSTKATCDENVAIVNFIQVGEI